MLRYGLRRTSIVDSGERQLPRAVDDPSGELADRVVGAVRRVGVPVRRVAELVLRRCHTGPRDHRRLAVRSADVTDQLTDVPPGTGRDGLAEVGSSHPCRVGGHHELVGTRRIGHAAV